MFNNTNLSPSPNKSNIADININTAEAPAFDLEKKVSSNEEITPLLFVDVNLGGDVAERIVVFEGDTAKELAKRFCD